MSETKKTQLQEVTESFKFLKDIFIPKNEEEWSDIDYTIRPLIKTINTMWGFATWESCMGHVTKQDEHVRDTVQAGYICVYVFDYSWVMLLMTTASLSGMCVDRSHVGFSTEQIIQYVQCGYDYPDNFPHELILFPPKEPDHSKRVTKWWESLSQLDTLLKFIRKENTRSMGRHYLTKTQERRKLLDTDIREFVSTETIKEFLSKFDYEKGRID